MDAQSHTAPDITDPVPAFGSRRIGTINWVGFVTLCQKEVMRFLKVGVQTVAAPAVTTMLFFAIFMVALGGADRQVGGLPFGNFLAPGLIMMAIVQNAFANTSSSVLVSKVQGNIVDVLMPPLGAGELALAYVIGGVVRGVMVAVAVATPMLFFVETSVAHPWAVVYFALSASALLSMIGLLGGIWSEKFDHLAAVTNFVVMPLSFLSGTFYSIDRLPAVWQQVSHANPFFYMIDGFRYGFIGRSDGDPLLGALVLAGLNLVMWLACLLVMRKGWRLKA